MGKTYTVQIWKEGGQCVAQALPLDAMSAGPKVDEVRKVLDEAVRVFLLTAQDLGTAGEILEEAGHDLRTNECAIQ